MEGIREIILKARQQGMSSFILALFTVDFLLIPYSGSICIAHLHGAAQLLFKKVKFYLDSYFEVIAEKSGRNVEDVRKEFLKSDTKGFMENAQNGATFYIGTASSKTGQRAASSRNLHFCVGENTKVILSDGSSKPIKNIEIGDKVISRGGVITPVVNKWDTGIKPIKRIRLFGSKKTIDVSPDHKISVLDGESYRWKKAKDLTTKDFVENIKYRKNIPYTKFIRIDEIINTKPQQTYEIEVKDKSHCYLTICGVISNSEVSFFVDTPKVSAKEIIEGSTQQVAQGYGKIFIESTGKYSDNYYYDLWQKANETVKGVPQSIYAPRFFSAKETYSSKYLEIKRKEFINEAEFLTEYPMTEEDAFIVGGTPFFDKEILRKMEKKCKDPKREGRFFNDGKLDERKDGSTKVWRELEPGEQVTVFADPADVNDYCAAAVCSKKYLDYPMLFYEKMESSQFGYELYYLCKHISIKTGSWPKLAVERNTGQATIFVLKQLNYPNLFRMVDFSSQNTMEKGRIGWSTTGSMSGGVLSGSRRKMFDDFALALKQELPKIYDKEAIRQLGGFQLIEGKAKSTSKHDDIAIACYSDDTEALTSSGWKLIKDIKEGEEIPSLNIQTNKVEMAINKKTINRSYEGKMLNFKNRSIDFLVTPNHKMLVHKSLGANKYKDMELVEAKKLIGKHFRLHKDAIWDGIKKEEWIIPQTNNNKRKINIKIDIVKESRKHGLSIKEISELINMHERTVYTYLKKERLQINELKFKTNDFLSLLGFYIAEGSGSYSKKHGGQLHFSQMEYSKGYAPFKELLEKMKIKYFYTGTNFIVSNAQLAKYIKYIVPGKCYEKRIPRDVLDLHPNHLKYLFNFMMLGDGYFEKGIPNTYITTSPGLRDDFFELINKMGLSATYNTINKIGENIFVNRTIRHKSYQISIINKQLRPRINHHEKNGVVEVDYKGNQVCLTLNKNNTFLVRRKTRTMWCGNCLGSYQIQMLTPSWDQSDIFKTEERMRNDREKWRFR